jgi:hypothetical protein
VAGVAVAGVAVAGVAVAGVAVAGVTVAGVAVAGVAVAGVAVAGVGVWANAGAAFAIPRARTNAMLRFRCLSSDNLGIAFLLSTSAPRLLNRQVELGLSVYLGRVRRR